MSHHPKNTVSAIHSAGLAVQAGNNLGNSHLQVSGGWQHGRSFPGNEGRDEKEHGFEIALMHAAAGDWHCRREGFIHCPAAELCILFAALMRAEMIFVLERQLGLGKFCVNLEQKEKVQSLGEMHEKSCHPTLLCLLLGRVRDQLWCLSRL